MTRLGAAHSFDQYTTLSGDFVLHNDTRIYFGERLRTHIGIERWLFRKGLGLRLGYTAVPNRLTTGEWSTGLSIQSSSGQLDYAYVRGNELDGAMHWISATLRWGNNDDGIKVSLPPVVEAPPAAPIQPAPIVMPKPPPIVIPEPPPIVIPEPPPVVVRLPEKIISPNGDGMKDQINFDLEVAEGVAWELEIQKRTDKDKLNRILQRYSGTGPPSTKIAWEGEDDAGNRVSDGTYTAQWFIIDLAGDRQLQSEVKITVDTTPASLDISAEPPVFATSDQEKILQMPKVHLQASDLNSIARWDLQFFDEDQKLVHRIAEDGEPSDTVVWNNWKQSDSPEKATYRCVLTVHDSADNRSTGEASFSTIRVDREEPDDREHQVVVRSSEEKPEEVKASHTPPRYTLMVGSFQNRKNAESLVDSLEAMDLRAKTHLTEVIIRSKLWYRVTIGGFHNREDAAELISQVVEMGMEPLVISNVN